jgi:hypothetical protein
MVAGMKVNKLRVHRFRFPKSNLIFRLNRGFCVMLTIIIWILIPIQVLAQQIDVKVGSLVKLEVPTMSREKLVGNISSLTDTTMFLDVGNSTYIIPLASIEEILVSTGIRTNKREGAFEGLIAGGSIGSIIGFFTYKSCVEKFLAINCLYRSTSRNNAMMRGATVGVVSGALIGRLIGSINTDRWENIPNEILLNMEPVGALQPSTHPQLTLRWSMGSKK